jgi:NADH dehydrogenase/NADH:ubiquinone oxidoreductase subunit G
LTKDIYGEHTMGIPDIKSLKILEERQIYLLKKLQCGPEKKWYLIQEIRTLDQTINFIKWIINNLSDDMIKNTVEKYNRENCKNTDEEIEADKEMIKNMAEKYKQEISRLTDKKEEAGKEKAEIEYGFFC